MKVKINGLAWLNKNELTELQLEALKKQLTITQSISPEYANRIKKQPPVVKCFVETDNGLGIAREFFFSSLTKQHDITYEVSNGDAWPEKSVVEGAQWGSLCTTDPFDLTFIVKNKEGVFIPAELRGEQKDAVDTVVDHLNSRPAAGGIVQAPTGWGKTIACLGLIRRMKLKTAVLVHRSFLANQWKQRIADFLPDAKVGMIQGDEWDVEDKHIVIVMIETLASWVKNGKVPPELSNMFGLVISDETHRVGAPTWAATIQLFNAAKRIGVSATPRRSDGLDKVFWYHIGPKLYTGKELRLQPKIRRVWSTFNINGNARFNPDFLSKEAVVKIMRKNAAYNSQVVEQIILALNAGRRIIVFSDVVDHLKAMHSVLENDWTGRKIKIDYFIGGMSQDELDEASSSDVLFATYKMAAEGMDIPPLDTAVLATPIRNPEQTIGRILRPFEGKKDPVVVDMRCDSVKVCRDYAQSRDRLYEKIYKIENKNVTDK